MTEIIHVAAQIAVLVIIVTLPVIMVAVAAGLARFAWLEYRRK